MEVLVLKPSSHYEHMNDCDVAANTSKTNNNMSQFSDQTAYEFALWNKKIQMC